MLRVDPNPLSIVSPRGAFDWGKAAPAIDRAVSRAIRNVDHLRIVGCHRKAARSGSGASHRPLGIDPVPALASVVGAVEPAALLSRFGQQVDPVWPGRRNRQPNPSPLLCFGQTTAELPPGTAAVRGLEQSASRCFDRLATANFPRDDAGHPERGIQRPWIAAFK